MPGVVLLYVCEYTALHVPVKVKSIHELISCSLV